MAIILKEFHYSLSLPWIVTGAKHSKSFAFTESCKYDLKTEDQLDWNKLYGFTLGLIGPKDQRNPVHYNSVRFGWRYNVELDVFEISAYCYSQGVRKEPILVGSFPVGKKIELDFIPVYGARKISMYLNSKLVYTYKVPDEIQFDKLSKGWVLHPYFGGNRTAPRTMCIKRK